MWDSPITVVVQTTQTKNNFDECVKVIKKRCTNAEISDTICFATSTRQEEAAALSQDCDAMIVIGGRHSANSLHLAEICRQSCENVQFIERPEELDFSIIKKSPVVGLTAGASTPAWIIKEVVNKMSDEIRVEEIQEEAAAAETPVVEAAEAPVEQAAEAVAEAPAAEKELSFDEMLEETLKTIYNGEKVSGTVVSITGTEVSVDLGAKYSGFIPTTEFTEAGMKVEDAVKVGDTIEIEKLSVNEGDEVALDTVCAVSDGTTLKVGTPYVEGAKVTLTIVAPAKKGEKVINFKAKRRKGYRRTVGHRQQYTVATVKAIA